MEVEATEGEGACLMALCALLLLRLLGERGAGGSIAEVVAAAAAPALRRGELGWWTALKGCQACARLEVWPWLPVPCAMSGDCCLPLTLEERELATNSNREELLPYLLVIQYLKSPFFTVLSPTMHGCLLRNADAGVRTRRLKTRDDA